MRFILSLLSLIMLTNLYAQPKPYADQLAHTFSIVARDASTGEMAVAVQSHWFSVGSVVAWGKSGVGVVATQSFVNPAYGPEGLALMEQGISAQAALQQLLKKDSGKAVRQVAFIDVNGDVAAHTGERCIVYAGHTTGDNFSVQANMMLNDAVVPAMEAAFKNHAHLPLPERVMAVLAAAQQAGGDIRGKQSAALLVVGGTKTEAIWQDKKIDLRVEDHQNPIQELQRLLKVYRAYEFMNQGDVAMEHDQVDEALDLYAKAEALLRGNLEPSFWKAVSLWNSGEQQEATKIFKTIFKQEDNWRLLLLRLPESGLINREVEALKNMARQ
ncbi:MAG: DUF1028 domain-containing protein [Flavobacteriaceae bacterium]|nr:DUF1028 domain-containing protein [Flavobacteriaceae bacterium]